MTISLISHISVDGKTDRGTDISTRAPTRSTDGLSIATRGDPPGLAVETVPPR